MRVKRIVILGCGQLGSRHLQGLALIKESLDIFAIDPSKESLETARVRFEEIQGSDKHNLYLYQSISDLTYNELDLAIVATNSSVRARMVENLVKQCSVTDVILEKFLFQQEEEYLKIQTIFHENSINAYVNCPRRLNPSYAILKEYLIGSSDLTMEVFGNNWGLGCNSIHFIDLFQWITGNDIVNWTNQLDNGYFSSKRKGYIEFTGSLEGETIKSQILKLSSSKSSSSELKIVFKFEGRQIVVDELKGLVYEVSSDGEHQDLGIRFKTLYQSELTNLVAEKLFLSRSSGLTKYDDSIKSHLPLFRVLLNHYNQFKEHKELILPIT